MSGPRRLSEEQQASLEQVAQARRAADDARSELVASIRRCHAAGCSLRAISEAAGMSRQRVHQILRGE